VDPGIFGWGGGSGGVYKHKYDACICVQYDVMHVFVCGRLIVKGMREACSSRGVRGVEWGEGSYCTQTGCGAG